jgi:hypothetical protein
MPLLEVVQTHYVSASIRLRDSIALQVDQYATFIGASADDVIEQALSYVFSKDRDFQDFLKSAQAQRITPTLRIRRQGAVAVQWAEKKPASGTESNGSVVAGSLLAFGSHRADVAKLHPERVPSSNLSSSSAATENSSLVYTGELTSSLVKTDDSGE